MSALTSLSTIYALFNSRPFVDYSKKMDDGDYPAFQGNATGVNGTNPFFINQYTSTSERKIDVLQSFNLNYQPVTWLELDAKYGLNYQTQNNEYIWQNQTQNANIAITDYYRAGIVDGAAGEIQNPQRNIPLSLFFGTLLVSLLYISANFVYIMLLPASGSPDGVDTFSRGIAFASNERVGTAAAEMIFGAPALIIMAIFIMISTFGCNNGIVLSGARVYYAMAKDGLFFQKAQVLNPKGVPAYALILQCAWACLVCISGKYSDLLKYVTFATLLFYILTIGGIFILRHKRPHAERPYKAFGYPLVPFLYIVVALSICINLLVFETPISLFGLSVKPSWVGLGIVLLGVPVYYFWKKR